MSSTGAVQEQGVGIHDVGAVALKNTTTLEDVFHSYFVTRQKPKVQTVTLLKSYGDRTVSKEVSGKDCCPHC